MLTFPAAMRDAIRSVQCALLADNEYVVGSVGRFAGPVRQRALDGINFTRDLLGCPPSPDIEEPPPDFEGGQCNDVYLVTATRTTDLSGTSTGTFRARGPIGGTRVRQVSGTNYDWEIFASNINLSSSTCGALANGTPRWIRIGGVNSSDGVVSASIDDIVPCGLDNCGDPPPNYPAPVNYNTDVDVTYNIDDGTEVTVTVPVVYAPITVDFNGNFRIPVTFDFGGNEFSASFPLDVSIPVTINFPGLNPGDGQGVDDLPPDEPGETVPPVPPEEKIIGVVVNVLSLDERKVSPYSSPGIPRILVPRVGSVKFAYSIGAATFWSPDIDVKGDREFIPCPFSQGADLVVASPQIGVELDYVPIRGFPLATKADIPPSA